MPTLAPILAGLVLALGSVVAEAQGTLGELLDAGAKPLSADDFRHEVVQRIVFGPTPTGGSLDVMYASNGTLAGSGIPLGEPPTSFRRVQIAGTWTIDPGGAVCTAMRIGGVALPSRCQVWFRLGNSFFISDSDSDRYARVLRRDYRADPAAPAPAATSLGQLLDAGATRLTVEDFRREIAQRTVSGPTEIGGRLEVMFSADGAIQGVGTPQYAPQLLVSNAQVTGEWRADEAGRICTSMRILAASGAPAILPARCQWWFRLNGVYFVSDSSSDRRAKVLVRALKP